MLIIGKKLSPYALLSISGLLAASDQAVKWLVQQSMAYGESISVTSFFNWVHLWNTGAAFSLFAIGGIPPRQRLQDRKSTRLNSIHVSISYAVLCQKKKTKKKIS